MAHFFISYKREDSEFVDKLEKRLETAGLPAFRDIRMEAGEKWKQEIDNALDDCYALILVFSPATLESDYVFYEWAYAMGGHKKVIPIGTKEFDRAKLHLKLQDLHWINFEDSEEFWERLIAQLQLIQQQDSRNKKKGSSLTTSKVVGLYPDRNRYRD